LVDNEATLVVVFLMRRYSWIWTVVALALVGCLGRQGVLRPGEPSATPGPEAAMIGQPQLVTFSELQAAPYTYRDRFIRVSGLYALLPVPDCFPSSGPPTGWALISEGLRLDGIGFDTITRRIPQGITLTVDGILRLYEGPVGCGKRPPAGYVWFLEARQIIQPNPLVLVDGVVADAYLYLPPTPALPGLPAGGPGSPTAGPSDGDFPSPVATVTGTITATGTAGAIPTASSTATITTTPPAGTATTTTTPTVTATGGAGGPTATSTPTSTPAGTPGEPPTPLPLPTPTTSGGGGGYPAPPTPPSYP
jgi:hypothetical protein